MGNLATESTKRQSRRKRARKLIPHAPAHVVDEIALIDDPLERSDALVDAAVRLDSSPATVHRCEQYRLTVLTTLLGSREAAAQFLFDRQPEQPDDARYRPQHVDSVLRGAGRAVGETAAAVKRGRTVTAWQYDERRTS